MKNILFLAIAAIFCLFACKNKAADSMIKVPLGEPFELSENMLAKVKKAKTNIHFLEVKEDSRCPTGANCVWEGQVTARFIVNVDTVDITMRGVTETSENVGEYDIKLLEINPYPSIDKSEEKPPYSVKLQVEEQVLRMD